MIFKIIHRIPHAEEFYAQLKSIKLNGGLVIVQDPLEAESPTIPASAIEAVDVDKIIPLDQIGPFFWTVLQTNSPELALE